MCSIRSASTSG
ncbi:hypothetical protein Ahy_B06g081084 isoform F [Arachis hypogaea]|uniref:Uncharacterized protein n=1 Tax=Arachis hypogaea TaxID=3818 RepID=A0A444YK38_ARAHY|nr:hypothetical protein Ahy_B06g081084 isoform F [Arachis hypogaea]